MARSRKFERCVKVGYNASRVRHGIQETDACQRLDDTGLHIVLIRAPLATKSTQDGVVEFLLCEHGIQVCAIKNVLVTLPLVDLLVVIIRGINVFEGRTFPISPGFVKETAQKCTRRQQSLIANIVAIRRGLQAHLDANHFAYNLCQILGSCERFIWNMAEQVTL